MYMFDKGIVFGKQNFYNLIKVYFSLDIGKGFVKKFLKTVYSGLEAFQEGVQYYQ